MKHFLKVVVFSVFVVAAFAGYANWGIPQITPAPPPTEEKIDLSAMTMDQFVALGDRIVQGKGTCTLCHNSLGRAPMLENLGELTKQRLADERYEGEADGVESYLMESMVKPSAYVVPGFGKAGSNDTVSPMPDVSAGSIGLSEVEMAAVIAYLQESSGVDVTVEIPSDAEPVEEEEEAEQREPFENVEDILSEYSCGACHKIGEEEGDVGPDLRTIGAKFDREYLRRALLDPNADVNAPYEPDTMPAELGTELYAKELEMLVDYLANLK